MALPSASTGSSNVTIPDISTPGDPFGLEEGVLNNVGRIPRMTFSITCGLFFGLACVAVLVCLLGRLVKFHRLSIDDAFLIVGVCFLAGGTACLYMGYETVFIIEAVTLNPTTFVVPPQDYPLLFAKLPILEAYLTVTWTATHAVKGRFLALFHTLLQRAGTRLRRWWWCTVVVATVSWIFFAIEPFVLCPYTRADIAKCLPQVTANYSTGLALTIVGTALDMFSDLMIISIPIFILRKTQISRKQKVILAMFLCLSLVMLCVAFVRVAGFGIPSYNPLTKTYSSAEDLTYDVFWVYMEACIAHIMASLTTMRTLFGHTGSGNRSPKNLRKWYSPRNWREASTRKTRKAGEGAGGDDLPEIPSGTLSGMKTFIRRNGRDPGLTTRGLFSTNISWMDPIREDFEMHSRLVTPEPGQEAMGYHVVIRGRTR